MSHDVVTQFDQLDFELTIAFDPSFTGDPQAAISEALALHLFSERTETGELLALGWGIRPSKAQGREAPPMDDELDEVWNCPTVGEANFGDVDTIGRYIMALGKEVWKHEDGFSGKRPYGNSGWKYGIYISLIEAGLAKGSLDEDGYLNALPDGERERMDGMVLRAIIDRMSS